MPGRGVRLLPGVLAASLLLTGCGGGDDDDPAAGDGPGASATATTATGSAPGTDGATDGTAAAADGVDPAAADEPVAKGSSAFVVLNSGAWFLSQGIKPIGASREQYLKGNKSFDWYADYADVDADQSLRITGRLRSLAAESAALKKSSGAALTPLKIDGRDAVWADLGGSGGVVVLLAFGRNYTIELASSGVAVQPTLALARALKPADEAAWTSAGGQVIDCPPGGDACPN